jgi:F0F1-type ATP synthase alpha subunit
MRNRNVSGLLSADDLAVRTTTSTGMQRAINSIKEYCEEWKLEINTNKTKIVVFKKGGKLSKYENLKLGGEEIEVANEIKCLGIIVDGRGKWEKEKRQVVIKGKTALNSINICIARAPNMGISTVFIRI